MPSDPRSAPSSTLSSRVRDRLPGGAKPSSDSPELRDAAHGTVTSYVQGAAVRVFRLVPQLRRRTMNAGQVADFVDWQSETFGRPASFAWTREQLWDQIAERLDPARPLVVFEFGVAWGYATGHWLTRLSGADVEWHGFDRFTGLPRAWRDMPEGMFDAGGQTPPIDDPRITWHVGDVEHTLSEVDFASKRDAQWLVLFDLDLYEPTADAWKALSPHLQPGDLLYFDEAIDGDERRILDEMVLPSGAYRPLGATSLALGLEVTAAPGA